MTMHDNPSATVLIVPGLRDHVADHWQTHLASALATTRKVVTIPPLGADRLSCPAQVAALQSVVTSIHGPIVAVAHSGGVITLAHWAQRHQRPRQASLLAAPPDVDTPMPEGYPRVDTLRANGWMTVPRGRLPSSSLVLASSNDPLASLDRVAELARGWGSAIMNLGTVGH